jgi:hypothetical protein
LGCAAALALAATALAEDPPDRVGSLNYVSGEVAYALRGEAGEPNASDALTWIQADFDQPVSEDMSLRTGRLARARIRIGPDAIEMSGDTELNMLNITDRLIEASVKQGRVFLQVNRLGADESVEIEISRGSLWLLQPGGYDIEVGPADQPTRITVHDGKARFVGGDADAPVGAGAVVEIAGTYPAVTTTERTGPTAPNAPPTASFVAPAPPQGSAPGPAETPAAETENDGRPAASQPGPVAAAQPGPAAAEAQASPPPRAPAAPKSDDAFLYFVAESNTDPQVQQSAQHVSAQTTGYDDLDRYGHWETLPDSEAVWFPSSVPADWAPYRFGHWVSIAPWGWTWVDDSPWGFAPFHYGRWVNLDGRWGWVPGPVQADPVYAPALVAFVDPNGPGADQGAGPDGPDVGWFPLGPGDPYAPWYVAGAPYVERVNVVVRARDFAHGDIGRGGEAWRAHYANRQFATAVPRDAFAGGRPVQQAMAHIPPGRLAHAAVMPGAPHLVSAAARTLANPEGARGQPTAAGGRGAAMQPGRGDVRSSPGRPSELSRNPAARVGLARPEATHARSEGYRGGGQQFASPGAFRGGQQFASPGAFRGGQQFANPGAFRGGQQFASPGAFRTPGSAFGARNGPMMGRAMPQLGRTAAPAHVGTGASAVRHK